MNLHSVLTEIEKIDPEVFERLDGRREAVKKLKGIGGKIALAAVPLALGSLLSKAYGQSSTGQIVEVLNFALTLEYLEAEFYTVGLASPGLIPTGDDRNGKSIDPRDLDACLHRILLPVIAGLNDC